MSINIITRTAGADASLGARPGILARNPKVTDPLASLPFLVRMQARGTKIGLWQDTAATVPATIGSNIAAETDAFGTGGLAYTQATALQQPTYVLGSDGKPVIRCTLTTRLDPPAGSITPVSVFALLQNKQLSNDFQSHYIICDNLFLANRVAASFVGGTAAVVFGGTNDTIGTPTSGFDLLEAQGAAGATYTAINSVITPQADAVFSSNGYYIGNQATPASGMIADVIALLIFSAALTGPQQTTVRNYLLSL